MDLESLPYLGEGLALTTGLVWAVAVILFRQSGQVLSPMGLNLFKNSLPLLPFGVILVLNGDLLRPELFGLPGLWLFLSGAVGLGIGDTLFLASLRRLGASRSAIVSCLYSPGIFALSWLLLGEALTQPDLIGGGLILSSIVLASWERSEPGVSSREIWIGTILGALAVLVMGAGIVPVKRVLEDQPLIWSTTVRVLGGVLGLGFITLWHPERAQIWGVFRPQRIWRLAIPGSLLGGFIAAICWIGGFKYADASVASLLNQTSTVFTVVLAAMFLREPLTRARVMALVLALSGSVLVIVEWG